MQSIKKLEYIYVQAQRPGEFKMQQAMLIPFKLMYLFCFSANFY